MNALVVKEYQNGEIKYLTFSNQDGKQWSMPINSMRVALELYEPSGVKGKILKKLLPLTAKMGVAKRALRGTYTNIVMSDNLKDVLVECFGEEWDFSVFWGTPCVDQKVTIQIYREEEILGYCKIGNSERVKELFNHEKKILDMLQQAKMQHVARCLAFEQVTEECWVLIQSTEKVQGVTTEHDYGEKQSRFLEQLWDLTKEIVLFDETDYCQSLVFLEQHIDLLDNDYREIVKKALDCVKDHYQGKSVEWGVSHGDFTPWNTCVVDGNLFVFDFEYALRHAPKGIDRWHFFVQTKHFEEKYDMLQIANEYRELSKAKCEQFLFICYLLDVIALYLVRGESVDIKVANDRAKLLNIIYRQKEEDVK